MQTLRKLSSKKGKFEGIQLGEVVSKHKNDNNHNISHVITHTEPSHSIKGNKENATKRAEKVVSAIQKRYDNSKKNINKETDIQSPIISIKLVKNEITKPDKRPSPIKPKLVSPMPKKVSFEKKSLSQIKPKLISPVIKDSKRITSSTKPKLISPTSKEVKRIISQNKSEFKQISPSKKNNNQPFPMNEIKYNNVNVLTLLNNYSSPKKPYINDYRYKIYTQYYNIFHNMRSFTDRFILTNLSNGIRFI